MDWSIFWGFVGVVLGALIVGGFGFIGTRNQIISMAAEAEKARIHEVTMAREDKLQGRLLSAYKPLQEHADFWNGKARGLKMYLRKAPVQELVKAFIAGINPERPRDVLAVLLGSEPVKSFADAYNQNVKKLMDLFTAEPFLEFMVSKAVLPARPKFLTQEQADNIEGVCEMVLTGGSNLTAQMATELKI